MNQKSKAFELIEFVWNNERTVKNRPVQLNLFT